MSVIPLRGALILMRSSVKNGASILESCMESIAQDTMKANCAPP